MLTRGEVTNLITARVAYRVATDADVPGITGSSAADIDLYDRADLGWRVLVQSNGNRYTKTSQTAFGSGGRITPENGNANATQLQSRPVASTAPTSGQALAWNGAAWAPADVDATKLQTRAVASTAPTSGQALAWNGAAWAPATIASTPLSDATPSGASGVGSPGAATDASRSDHVHPATINGETALTRNGTSGVISPSAARYTYDLQRGGAASLAEFTNSEDATNGCDLSATGRITSSRGLVPPSGTVAEITGGLGIWAAPVAGQMALATDANVGAGALAVRVGGAWLMATLAPIA
jgi:hypothetical protein